MKGDKKSLFNNFKDKQFLSGLLIGFVIVLVILGAVFLVINLKNNNHGSLGSDTGGILETESVTNPKINTFELKKNAKICKDDDQPIIYLFTASWCPHCQWIKDTFQSVMSEYIKAGKIKAYNYDAETGDDLLTPAIETSLPASAQQVLNEFNPEGSIPTFVFGCKYFRVGNGYEQEDNLAKEAEEFKAIIDELLN